MKRFLFFIVMMLIGFIFLSCDSDSKSKEKGIVDDDIILGDEDLVDEDEPVVDEDEPVVDEEEPVVDEDEPLVDEDEPLVDEDEPLVDEDEPLVDEDEPLVDEDEDTDEDVIVENPCDLNPCSDPEPFCYEDDTEDGYTCYPEYTVGWCILQWPHTIEAFAGDEATVYGRVFVEDVTDVTQNEVDIHPLLKAQFGGRPVGGDFAHDSWTNAEPNPGTSEDWGYNDEYMLNASLPYAGEYEYTFRFSADGGETWTICDTEDTVPPYDPEKLGYAIVYPFNEEDLVKNKDFEFWSGDPLVPFGWDTEDGISAEQESALKHSGDHSAKITRTLNDDAKVQILSDFIPTEPLVSYTLSGWFLDKAEFDGRGRLMVTFFDSSKTFIDNIFHDLFTSDNENWQQMEYVFDTPVNTAYLKVGMRLYKSDPIVLETGNIIYIDNFSLVVNPE